MPTQYGPTAVNHQTKALTYPTGSGSGARWPVAVNHQTGVLAYDANGQAPRPSSIGVNSGTPGYEFTSSFSPAALSWAVWLDGDSLAGLADVASITTWPDSSGNSRDATQGTAGNKPTKRTVNGRPVVRFDGTDDWLQTAAFAADIAQPTAIIVAFKLNSVAAQTYLFDGLVNGKRQIAYADPTAKWVSFAGSDFLTGGALDTNWHVLTAVYNGASSVLRLDGTQLAAGTNIGTNPLSGLTVGIVFDLTSSPFNGDMGDLLLKAGALTTAEMQAVERHLGAKRGVAVA